jgi:hypothetical protein
MIRTPYIKHTFGEAIGERYRTHRGWLTAGVASSISWPKFDVWVQYNGHDYFLRGSERDGKPSPPGITVPCKGGADVDETISKVYRFTSILSWFMGGFVDVAGYMSGSHPILYGDTRNVFSTLGIAGSKSFNCNHMPIVDDENVRNALAFWREGQRLIRVHDGYAFLSFYKVIESQFAQKSSEKVDWFRANIDSLTDRAAKRVAELRANGIDVSRHLFDSGRCAVAHASLEGEIVNPDIPTDRRRLSADLVVIEELARIYIRDELKVPESHTLYGTRNRLEPWTPLLPATTLQSLREGGTPDDVPSLTGLIVSVGLWPDGPIPGLEKMTMQVDAIQEGVVRIVLVNPRKTVLLVFYLDFRNGRIHTNLEMGGLLNGKPSPDESDVRAYATFFYHVLANGICELTYGDLEPIDCEVVIPVNIIPEAPEKAIAEMVEKYRNESSAEAPQTPAGDGNKAS